MSNEPLKFGLIGGIAGLVLGGAANYFIFPVPVDALANGIGNGITGFISGFAAGFLGLTMYIKESRKATE